MKNLYNSNSSRSSRRWAWANRPIESLDSPVKRYIRNRPPRRGLKRRHRRVPLRFRVPRLRPAF